MARELGRDGFHVAHVIVDGAIDMPWIPENFPQLAEQRGEEARLKANAVAETHWQLHTQARSTWTHELDLRSHIEPW